MYVYNWCKDNDVIVLNKYLSIIHYCSVMIIVDDEFDDEKDDDSNNIQNRIVYM